MALLVLVMCGALGHGQETQAPAEASAAVFQTMEYESTDPSLCDEDRVSFGFKNNGEEGGGRIMLWSRVN